MWCSSKCTSVRMARWHNEMAHLSKNQYAILSTKNQRQISRTHDLRGDRSPLLHRHSWHVQNYHQRILRFRSRTFSRRGLALFAGKLMCYSFHRHFFLLIFIFCRCHVWMTFVEWCRSTSPKCQINFIVYGPLYFCTQAFCNCASRFSFNIF